MITPDDSVNENDLTGSNTVSNHFESEEDPNCCCFKMNRPMGLSLKADCQFVEVQSFYEVDGKYYCHMHMPLVDAKGRQTPKGSEIMGPFQRDIAKTVEETLEKAMLSTASTADLTGVQFSARFDFTESPVKNPFTP